MSDGHLLPMGRDSLALGFEDQAWMMFSSMAYGKVENITCPRGQMNWEPGNCNLPGMMGN